MKRKYETPRAEKLEFEYADSVTASGTDSGHKYRLYTDGYYACRETETNTWVNGDMDSSCTWN